jgi:hypothetical protein
MTALAETTLLADELALSEFLEAARRRLAAAEVTVEGGGAASDRAGTRFLAAIEALFD